ncbi:pitrilysin family protein [Sphingomonas sp.]|uniref:M16 family metallopeptidase n=1 Tax=Sphingomonas sp. TaxID=28214 RepID=UPI001D72A44A|nr:pitrilysin family protein [Sphingomonas sp.]MBX9795452.1 insulinase family protein [Sphingomonas sp.]
MMLRAALLLGVAALPFAAEAAGKPGRPAAAKGGKVERLVYTGRTLSNGLRVYAIRDTSTANVAVHVWYDVGSKDDPKGRSGFAHMFEHLMFKATRNLVPEQFDRLTEDVGGFNNASTDDDYTNYYETVPANHLERLLFAEADRMASLVVEPKVFASERDVVKEELRQRVLAQPYGRLFYLYFPEISYAAHPYARPGIGSLEDLEAASIDDVRAFHATYYRPDNAVLVVAGNFDPKQLDQWVDKYFAPIKRPTTPIPRVTVAEPPRTAAITRTVYEDNVPLPAVLMSFQVPPDRDADNAPLAVLNAIMSEGESSRLYESLVYRDQLAVNAGTFMSSRQSTGALAVYAILAGGKTAAQGEAALKREIARLRDAPVTAAELAKARNRILTSTLRARETADGKASALAEAIIIDGDPAAADRQLAEIAAVTAADVQRVARRYLGDNQAAIVRYLPRSAQSPKGDSIGIGAGVQVAVLAPPANITVHTPAPEAERLRPPPPAAPVAPRVPQPVTATLANGLKVVVVERHTLPLVSAVLAVPGGAAADGSAAGLNALTAELVTKGTKTRSATQIARAVEALGGSIDSNGDWDGATLTVSVKADQAAKALEIMADAARNPVFAQDEIDRARSQTIDGIGVELKDPARLASFVASRAVFGDGAYGSMLTGTPGSLKAITRAQISAAYTRHWRPDRATLVLSGDLTAAQGLALARSHFGGWTMPKAPAEATPAITAATTPRVIVVDLPGTGQAGVVIARAGIARSAPGFHAAQAANAVLGTGFSARLNQEIRIKRGLAYGAGSSLGARAEGGQVAAQTQTKNPSAPEVVGLILAEMKRLGTEPVTEAELDTRKQVLIGNFGRAAETTEGLAGLIGTYVLNHVPLDELQRYTPAIAGVSPAAVQAAAAKLLDPGVASIIVVGDAKQFVDELRKTYPNLELFAADKLNLDSAGLK